MKARKKLALILIALTALCIALTSCGKGNQGTSDKTSADSGTAAQTSAGPGTTGVRRIERVVIGTTAPNDVFNINSQGGAFGKMNYNCVATAYLSYIGDDLEVHPYFITDYKISDDGKELNITYPTDKVWHDGNPVTEADVIFTFEYYRDVMLNSYVKNLTSIEPTGKGMLKLTFSEPDAYQLLYNGSIIVQPKHIWGKITEPKDYAGADACIGCGPYKLVRYDVDAGVAEYEAVPENNYLGELTVDAITVRSYSSQDALVMAMANGEIDLMYDYAIPINYTLLDVISGKAGIDIGESDYSGNYQLTFGMEAGRPYVDRALREATVKAINWDLMVSSINGPYGQIPGSGVITPSCKGFDDSLWKLYRDIDESNRILDQAGYRDTDGDGMREKPDGSALKIKVTPQYTTKKKETLSRCCDIVIDSLREIGISSHLDEEALQSDEVWEAGMVDGTYDMNIGYCTSGIAQYRSAFRYFVADLPSDEQQNTEGTTWIWGTNHDPELTNAVWSLIFASSEKTYLEQIRKLQKMASEDLFACALCWEKAFFPYRTDKYTGFNNWNGIGVVNPETWYTITAK